MADGLAPKSPTSKRIWDAEPDRRFLFHYTHSAAAWAIFDQRTIKVGRRSGLYVCGYAPGAVTPTELRSLLLDGARDWRCRTEAVVVIEDLPPLRFERDDVKGDAWVHRADAGTDLSLPAQIIGYGVREEGSSRSWQLSNECYAE
jgi:hypothetical protein